MSLLGEGQLVLVNGVKGVYSELNGELAKVIGHNKEGKTSLVKVSFTKEIRLKESGNGVIMVAVFRPENLSSVSRIPIKANGGTARDRC